jgi:hypothetical protein
MIVNGNPMLLAGVAAQRLADLQNQVERERLANIAERHAGHRQRWADLSAARILASLTGLLAPLLMVARNG